MALLSLKAGGFHNRQTNHILSRTCDRFTPRFKTDIQTLLSVPDSTAYLVTAISLAWQISVPVFLPFLAETPLPSHPHSSSLWGVFESAEPRVRMFHRISQINVVAPPARRQSSLLAPSWSNKVWDCGSEEMKYEWEPP